MNTDKFPLLEKDTAPEASVEWLEKAEANFGMIPNVEKVMALSPQLLAGYTFMWDGFNTSSLDEQERQVVYLTANYENECNYCVPWHSILAEQSGLSEKDIEALRNEYADDLNLFLVLSQLCKDIIGQLDVVVLSVIDLKTQ